MSIFEKIFKFFSSSNNNSVDIPNKDTLLDLPEESENIDEIDKEVMEMDFIDDEDL